MRPTQPRTIVADRTRPKRRSEPRSQPERLQKVLAAAGVASRRAAEELIREGRVRVNGQVVAELGTRADPRRDRITVDGRRISQTRPRRSFLVYKPRGVVATTRDPHAKKTVLDLVPSRERLFPVGRLDAASEGLLLVTNDGALAQVLLHPSFQVPRTYRVSVDGKLSAETARQLSAGVQLRGRKTAPCELRVLARESDRSMLEITLIEGRRHQIREMMRSVGHPVRRLVRIRFGPLGIGDLQPGEARPLRGAESRALDQLVARSRAAAASR